MPRQIRYAGKIHNFPDDATDNDIQSALQQVDAPVAKPTPQPEKGIVDKGVDFVKSSLSDAYKAGGEAVDAGGKLASNIGAGNVFTDENAGLAGDVLQKGSRALLPLAPLAVGAGVATMGAVPTLTGLAAGTIAGYAGSELAKGGAKALGASENVQRLAGEVGGLVGGGATGTKAALGAARSMTGAAQRAVKSVTPEAQKAAQAVAQRVAEVDNIQDASRKLFTVDKRRQTPMEKFNDQFVDSTISSKGRIAEMAKANEGSPEDIKALLTNVENYQAGSRRPDAPQIAAVEKTGLENALRSLGEKRIGDMDGRTLAGYYMSAKLENARVRAGDLSPDQLPGGGGQARIDQNDDIIRALGGEFEDFAKQFSNFVKVGITEPAEQYGLISKTGKDRLTSGHPDYVKWTRPLTPVEEEAYAGLGGIKSRPAVGKGLEDELPFLKKQLALREPTDVIQATLDQSQEVHRTGMANMSLRELAKHASKYEPESDSFTGGGMLRDLKLVQNKYVSKLPEEFVQTSGKAPLVIDGVEYTLFGPPAAMNTFNGLGQVSADVSLRILPVVRNAMKGVSRVFKLGTTGVLAPARKGVNMVYNIGSIYQQLPLAVSTPAIMKGAKYAGEFLLKSMTDLPAVPQGLKYKGSKDFQRLREEGLKMSGFGSSSEIVRGVGEQNADYLASKGDLAEYLRFAIAEPVKEVGKAVTLQDYKPAVIKRIGIAVDDLFRSVEDLNSADEVGLKMGVYDVAEKYYLRKGMKPEQAKQQAIWDARNVIQDFTRRGNFAPNYDLLGMPFVQAATTGIRTNLMFAQQDPLGFAGRTALPVIGHAWLNAMNYADPKKARVLANIPVDFQARNAIFFTKGGEIEQDEKGRVTDGLLIVPMLESPITRSLAAGTIGLVQQQSNVENMATGLLMMKMAKHFLPVEPNPIEIAANMPALGTGAQLYENRDQFTGAPIVNPKSERNAPQWAKSLTMGDAKNAARLKWATNKMLPVSRYIDDSPPGRGGADAPAEGLLDFYGRTFSRPFRVAPGGGDRDRRDRQK